MRCVTSRAKRTSLARQRPATAKISPVQTVHYCAVPFAFEHELCFQNKADPQHQLCSLQHPTAPDIAKQHALVQHIIAQESSPWTNTSRIHISQHAQIRKQGAANLPRLNNPPQPWRLSAAQALKFLSRRKALKNLRNCSARIRRTTLSASHLSRGRQATNPTTEPQAVR